MKLARPSKVLLVGDTRGVEKMFLYFNKERAGSYPDKPLESISQVAGLVGSENTPILAFADDEAAMKSLETMIETTFEGEKISVGVIASFKNIEQVKKHFKLLSKVDGSILSRMVFFIDIYDTPEIPLPEGYGNDDFLPMNFVESFASEMKTLINYFELIPDSLRGYCLRAFDLIYFPISTSKKIGLEPSSQALIMEADN